MSNWTDYGLPIVEAPGYGYSTAAGLMRTPFEVPQPNQKRANDLNVRQFNVSVNLTQAQLANAWAAIHAFGFTWFTIDLISGYADDKAVPGVVPSEHTVRIIGDCHFTAIGWDLYKMDIPLETKPKPYEWIIAPGQVWQTSATPRYVGVRIAPLPFPAIVRAIRGRAGTWDSTVSSAFIVINGVRTDLITSPLPMGPNWLELEIEPIQVPQGATVDLAATMSSYAWVTDYYRSSALLSGFEAGAEVYPPSSFTDNAFGIDLNYRYLQP